MTKEHPVRSAVACLAAGVFVTVSVLGACTVAPNGGALNDAANYGLSVAAELRLARPQQEVSLCLRERANSASYPQGVSPGFTTTEVAGGAMQLTQWFYLKRGMTWTTRFVLRRVGDAATDVQVLLPIELTASQGYLRAALELIARCQANVAGAV